MSSSYNVIGIIGFLLVVLLIVRVRKGISTFKVFYPIFLNIIINQKLYESQYLTYLYFIMIALMIAADTISNIKLDFSAQSITS